MNALTPTRNSPPAKPTLPALSPVLNSLLDSAGSHEFAEALRRSPALLTECMDALPALEFTARGKAGQPGVRAVIGRRFALYPQPPRTEGEWAAWWADYDDVLMDVPLASLEAAMRQWIADPSSEFMPKPGKLKELAFTAPCRSLMRYLNAKRAVDAALTALPAPERQTPPADPEEVKKWVATFTAKPTGKPTLPSIAGKPDETGITPQMRALLERRKADAHVR